MLLSSVLVLLLATLCNAQEYFLQNTFVGTTFFDNFNFWTVGDPTFGYVHYVDQVVAEQYGMINTTNSTASWGVDTTQYLDPTANLGRLSIRLTSVDSWTHGLFILDLAHMPENQCGAWPAFWTLGSGTWPENGEINIIEFENTVANNLMALHTSASPNCTVAGSGQSGTLLTQNCANGGGYTGCGVSAATTPHNIGYDFNAVSGGVYAMEWTSTAIQIWFFPRDQIPASILEANGTVGPDPTTFGVPMANFQGSCDLDAHFYNHSLVFDTTFCGSYAGNTWLANGCPALDPTNGWQSCNDFVAANPQAFTNAYWEVNYLNVYQTVLGAVPTTSSSLSSLVPAVSTSSVHSVSGNAEGRSTTPTMSFPVSLTGSTTSTSSSTSVSGSDSFVTTSQFSNPSVSDSATAVPVSLASPSTLVTSILTTSTSTSDSSSSSLTLVIPISTSMPSIICPSGVCFSEVIVVQTITIINAMSNAPSPQIGAAQQEPMSVESRVFHQGRQMLDGTTTYWPEPLPPAYASSSTAPDADYGDDYVRPFGAPRIGSCSGEGCAVLDDVTALGRREIEHPEPRSSTSTVEAAPAFPAIFPRGALPAPLDPPNSMSPRAALVPSLPQATGQSGERHAERQYLPGGTVGFCSVPGSACNEHHKRDESMESNQDPNIVPGREQYLHTEITEASLMLPSPTTPPPIEPSLGADGIVLEPGWKRNVRADNQLLARQDTGMVYVTVVTTLSVPAYTPTTFSYDLVIARKKRSTSLFTDYPPHTCTSVVMVKANGVATGIGCEGLQDATVPKRQHISIANITSTITATRETGYPRLAGPDMLLNRYLDKALANAAGSTIAQTSTAVLLVSCAAFVITWWTAGA